MIIKSYLAFPKDGKMDTLLTSIRQLEVCEVIPAENRDVLILITELPENRNEDSLLEKIYQIDCLDHLTLVSGYKTNQTINL